MIVLLPNCAFLSETSRMLAIYRALEARGVRASIASHGGPYARLLDEAGVRWERIEPTPSNEDTRMFLDAVVSIGRDEKPFYRRDFMRRAVETEAEHLRAVGAKLAVIGFNLTSYLSSRLAGIPLAASHGGSFLPPVLDRGLCPVPVNPPKPEMARLPQFIQRWLVRNVPYWLEGPVRELNELARELDVQTLPSFIALMCADLTLVTDIPEIIGISREEMERWRPRSRRLWPTTRMRYTGPLFAKLDRPISERVDRFLAEPGDVVLVAPTSVQSSFLRPLVRSVRAAGVRVLLAATEHDVDDLDGPGVLVERILPNHLVMPRARAAVLMGGQGSVQTAMVSGTPFVGMPFHGEQELNVAVAERRGMAIRLSPRDSEGPKMTEAVRRLIEEPAFRQNAERVRALYEGVDGAAGAADAIVDFLGERETAKRPAGGSRLATSALA